MGFDLSTFDLTQAPTSEDDHFEFKSSRINLDNLATKLQKAASAFSNTGGGWFIAGVDGSGNADGGIPTRKGTTDLCDWVDKIIHDQVEPPPQHERKLIVNTMGRGVLTPDCAVLVVRFHESYLGPHQVGGAYYIRAGAHTVPARHFIVEALWAKRHFSKPRLTHHFRVKPGQEDVVQLGIVSLTDAPALNVRVSLSPLPARLKQYEEFFPLESGVIDRQNSFYFDVGLWLKGDFGPPVQLCVKYSDLAGFEYPYEAMIDPEKALAPKRIGTDSLLKIARSIESIDEALKKYLK